MTGDAVSTPAALRRVWRMVQRTEGACLMFLWSDQYQQLQSLRQRLDGQLRLRSQRLCVCELWADAETASPQADACLQSILQPTPGDEHNPLWLHMGTSSDNPHAVAQQVLARLNERRSQTLQWPRALIVSGPLGGDAWAARVAPDLWSVRALSLELALAAVDVATDWLHDAVATPLPSVMGNSASSVPRPTGYQALLRAWQQAWQAYQAAQANHENKDLNVDLAFICIEYAFQYQELNQAERILHEVELYLGNLIAEDFNSISSSKARQVSLWRSFKGDLQTIQGQLNLALANYEKSLEIRQKLVALTDESPQALRDLSVSLGKVGDVQRAQGQLNLALANYEKSLAIRQKLVVLTDESPQALQDWAVSVVRVIGVGRELEKPLPDLPVGWLRQAQSQARQRHGDGSLVDALAQVLAQKAV